MAPPLADTRRHTKKSIQNYVITARKHAFRVTVEAKAGSPTGTNIGAPVSPAVWFERARVLGALPT